jgi:ubiquinone/menaquinone biosynthesis C-methylase UbiE
MSEQHVDTSYEPFSREPEYIECNRQFVQELPLETCSRFLDLACGTGTISELVLVRKPDITIFGLDLSRESLSLGQQDFKAGGFKLQDGMVLTRGKATMVQIEGTADCLPFRDGWADIVFMGSSIHMLPDFDKLLREVRRVLKPGGLFGFNSSFYAGSYAPGTDHFYTIWWKQALMYILNKDAELKKQGLPGIKRQRGTAVRAEPWMSAEDWKKKLTENGFEMRSVGERPITMTASSWRTIGSYSGLARLVLSGYPVELASEAIMNAVDPALKEAGFTTMPRLWLEITALKK